LERTFGTTITLSTGRVILTRWVGEQHVREDLGCIPSFADWARAIQLGWRPPLCFGCFLFTSIYGSLWWCPFLLGMNRFQSFIITIGLSALVWL
jgi:hypothetical protein